MSCQGRATRWWWWWNTLWIRHPLLKDCPSNYNVDGHHSKTAPSLLRTALCAKWLHTWLACRLEQWYYQLLTTSPSYKIYVKKFVNFKFMWVSVFAICSDYWTWWSSNSRRQCRCLSSYSSIEPFRSYWPIRFLEQIGQ